MASLRKRWHRYKGKRKLASPVWWIRFRDNATGKVVDLPTEYEIGNQDHYKKALELRAKKTLEENQSAAFNPEEKWANWVPVYLSAKYKNRQLTLEKYTSCWKALSAFLIGRGVHTPRQLTTQIVLDYVNWRQDPEAWTDSKGAGITNTGVRAVEHNSALLDVRILRLLLNHASTRLGYLTGNPAAKLGLESKKPEPRHEISPEDEALIRAELKAWKKPEWMRTSFDIAMAHGCRLAATRLDLKNDVDLAHDRVRFREKRSTIHEVPISPTIRPLLVKLIEEGRAYAYDELPHRSAGREWSRFFAKFKRMHRVKYVFHCTRITVITRLARAGINEQRCMRFVGHSSSDVHRIYQKLKTEDLDACHVALAGALSPPSVPPPSSPSHKLSEPPEDLSQEIRSPSEALS